MEQKMDVKKTRPRPSCPHPFAVVAIEGRLGLQGPKSEFSPGGDRGWGAWSRGRKAGGGTHLIEGTTLVLGLPTRGCEW